MKTAKMTRLLGKTLFPFGIPLHILIGMIVWIYLLISEGKGLMI